VFIGFFLSSIVALELFAGCRTSREKTALGKFLKPFEKADHIVTPDPACFREAELVLWGIGAGWKSRRDESPPH
jgi:predicted nucleic acid-binding protein